MGRYEPAKNLLMKVREIAFIGKGHKPANKKTVFLLKADGNEETEARIRAHTQEESMELNDKQVEAIAGKVVELIKAAPPEEPKKVIPNPDEKVSPVKAQPAPDTTAGSNGPDGKQPAPASAKPGPQANSSIHEHIKAIKEAITPSPAPAEGDEEMEEGELIAAMQELVNRFEQLHATYEKCYGKCAGVEKGVKLSPATAEELDTNVAAKPKGTEAASEADFELTDDELKAVKAQAVKEAGLDDMTS